ncbi:tetratricopeptide repeat protein [Burkholderia alba]|uniref:tetratricopeptide repeat protein n=1 Tax=Burkholderia alba TaxID=2683677 RepID=UPI002B055CE9|nr:tetratricopeptide repeat protein [Burkholderia alba]
MTAYFYLIAATMCVLAAALLMRPWWWPFGRDSSDGPARVARSATSPARPSPALVAALVLTIFVIAGGGYAWTGSPAGLTLGPRGASLQPSGSDDAPRPAIPPDPVLIDQLAERMKSRPDDADGWRMLARAYLAVGRYPQAVEAFRQATRLRPDDAATLTDYAETLAIMNGRSLEGEPATLIAHALEIDPDHPKALALAGVVAYNRGDYKRTVQYWDRLLEVAPADSPLSRKIRDAVARVRQLADRPG